MEKKTQDDMDEPRAVEPRAIEAAVAIAEKRAYEAEMEHHLRLSLMRNLERQRDALRATYETMRTEPQLRAEVEAMEKLVDELRGGAS